MAERAGDMGAGESKVVDLMDALERSVREATVEARRVRVRRFIGDGHERFTDADIDAACDRWKAPPDIVAAHLMDAWRTQP